MECARHWLRWRSQSYTADASLSARKSIRHWHFSGKCPFRTEEKQEISFHPLFYRTRHGRHTDEMFDVVTAFETVYFWNDLPKAFTEVTRVLKRNGHFLICCELNNLSVKTWTNLIDGMIIRSCDELKSILLQSGFVSIASYKHEKGPLCIVARRRAE